MMESSLGNQTYAVIQVPVCNLRALPETELSFHKKDNDQYTQLLLDEKIKVLRQEESWSYIEAFEQTQYTGFRWRGYHGWVKNSSYVQVLYFSKPDLVVCDTYALLDCMDKTLSLSLGTYLSKEETIGVYYIITLPNGDKGRILKSSVECIPTFIQSCRSKTYLWRHKLLEYGTMMIGAPYLWGGRSFYKELSYSNFRSCDCSGLISLLYRLIGVRIPRDAHDQYLSTSLCEIEELEMGDVFFLAKKTAMDLKVYHVLLYIGGEKLLEASSDFNHTVLEKSCLERFQVKKKQLRQGMWVKALDSQIFFGKLWDGHISKNLFC